MKTVILLLSVILAASSYCMPHIHCHSPYRPRVYHRPPPPRHHHCHPRPWIAPTIIGSAILGSRAVNAVLWPNAVVVEQPTVIQQPVVVQPTPVVI